MKCQQFTQLRAFNLELGIVWWKTSLPDYRDQKIEARELWLLKRVGGIPKGKESEKRSPIVSSQTSDCRIIYGWNRLKAAQMKVKISTETRTTAHPQKSSQFISKLTDCQNKSNTPIAELGMQNLYISHVFIGCRLYVRHPHGIMLCTRNKAR